MHTQKITVRYTIEEATQIRAEAKAKGLSVSDYMRMVVNESITNKKNHNSKQMVSLQNDVNYLLRVFEAWEKSGITDPLLVKELHMIKEEMNVLWYD